MYLAGIALALVALSSCTKDPKFWYVETTTIQYRDVSEYNAFISEFHSLDDDATLTIYQAERKVKSLVNKYDGSIGTTITLKTGPTAQGPWTVKKTWTMTLK